MNIYHTDEFKEKEYDWSEAGRKKAKRYRAECIVIRIIVILLAFFEAFLVWNGKFLKGSGFVWWGLALIILLYGLLLACAAAKRKSAEHMSMEDKHDYNLYIYHHMYRNNPDTANKILLNNAILLVQLKKYNQAAQALSAMHIEKSNQMMNLLKSYIQMNDLEAMTECLEKIKPEKKKEYPIWIFVITLFLTYSFEFLGLCYGINREAGYEIRAGYLRISFAIVETGLAILMTAGIVWICRHLNIKEVKVWKKKVRKVISSVCLGIIAVCILLGNCMVVIAEWDNREDIIKKENGMTYLEVTKSSGYDSYTVQYKTNNPFIMKTVYRQDNDTQERNEQGDTGKDSIDQDSTAQDNTAQSSAGQGSTGQGKNTWDSDAYWTKISDGMRAVYEYLSKTDALQNLEFTESCNAKGEVYAIVSKGQEEKDGKPVNVEYGIYYNNEKTDENGTTCDEYVLEKKYTDGTYEDQMIDFYLVHPDTLEVTDEKKTTW